MVAVGAELLLAIGVIRFSDGTGDVWTLLNIGLGGYVVGRSGESIARTLAKKGEK
jgi:TctA family transporter